VSFSDEAVPAEEAAPESVLVAGGSPEEGEVIAEGQVTAAEVERDPMEVLASERDEYLLALQRTQADFENYRKRIQRLQEDQSARAASALVAKLLPVMDTLDLAQAHQSEANAESDDAKALTAARAMLLDILTKEGLERVDESAVPFDPAVHDAVAHTDSEDGGDGEVVIDQVLRSGYRWRGQVLRPAMVSVRG
jgi:molecular chaperone GrpE